MAHALPESNTQFALHLLGAFRLQARHGSETRTIPLSRRKVETLLAHLALFPNSDSHTREKLATLFWGDSSDAQARSSLRTSLAVIRRALGEDALVSERDRVELAPALQLALDVRAFESACKTSPEHAVELYGGELLPQCYDDWVLAERERLRALYVETLLRLTQQMRSQSEYARALEYARRVISVEPGNEVAYQHAMFCEMARGNRAAVVALYEECVRALQQELAVEPSQETRALYETILAQTVTQSDAARMTNLPRPVTSFVGREKEMQQLQALVTASRSRDNHASLITLLGAGGSGKTRLALQVGRALMDEFPDGVWWVDLSALTEPNLVPQQVAQALGVPENPHQPPHETLVEFLRAKQLLLMLDNCEHIVSACAQLAAALLNGCPQLQILATSREPLQIDGEFHYQVPTLTAPRPSELSLANLLLEYESVRLFVERAGTVNPRFVLNDANAAAVARICQRLDGIPLALELAAARVQVLSPAEIAARLDDRFNLLTRGSRVALPRQQTLRALIDWSYNLLSPDERVLFARLSIFKGGFTMEAAEQVCGALPLSPQGIFSTLAQLVSKSLVFMQATEDASRYEMLETIHEYAREKLGAAETDEASARHYVYFVHLAETAEPQLRGPEQMTWSERLEEEHANLRAALDWALAQDDANLALRLAGALHLFWARHSHVSEAQDWYKIVLAKSHAHNNALYLAKAYSGAGSVAGLQGDFAQVSSLHSQALDYFQQVGDQFGVAFSLHNLAWQKIMEAEFDRAQVMAERALAAARVGNSQWVASRALNILAWIFESQGDNDAAMQCYQEALALAQANEDPGTLILVLHNLGCIESRRGNYPRAAALLAESLQLAQAMRTNTTIVATLAEQGLLFIRQGDYAAAVEVCRRSARLALEFSFKEYLARALEWLGAGFGYQNRPDRAAQLWGVAAALRERIGAPLDLVYRGDYDRAVAAVQQQLGAERFAILLAQGQRMTEKQVQDLISS